MFIARFAHIQECQELGNPGGIALPSFGKPAPLCPALTERDRERLEAEMAERLNIAREVARAAPPGYEPDVAISG